jgi:hypothetical protein
MAVARDLVQDMAPPAIEAVEGALFVIWPVRRQLCVRLARLPIQVEAGAGPEPNVLGIRVKRHRELR